jgi:N-acetylmuramoyl-L-alanine amidase
MDIITLDLKFGKLLPRSNTGRVVIHHSASPDVSAAEIHRWHLQRGWSGIGYHLVIREDGSIEEGRPLDTIGSHAGSEGNSDSIGVCLAGDFTRQAPTIKQMESLVKLIDWLTGLYSPDLVVVRHCDIAATQCPGDLFPWSELQQALKSQIAWKEELMNRALSVGLMMDRHQADEPAPKWFVAALVLNLLDLITVNAQGND